MWVFCLVNNIFSQTTINTDNFKYQLKLHWSFAKHFYEKKQYYRSITELYRLKFYYGQNNSLAINNLLAKNYYLSKDYQKLFSLANTNLLQTDRELFGLTSLAYLQLEDLQNAKNYWNIVDLQAEFYTPKEQKLLNSQKAFWLSVFPGAGFIYTKNYGKAFASLLLNSIFFYGIITSYEQEQFVTSYLLFFFEYQFYTGGMKAARETAEKHNQEILQKDKKFFIQLYEKKFGIH